MNTLFFWITIIQTYIYASNGQYVTIWEDNMDTNNNLWTGYNQFDFGKSSSKCQLNTCARVSATNGNSWIQRTTNISLYHSIELQIDITGYELETGDTCQIFYNYDNNQWIKLGDWGNNKYKNEIINFPQSYTANILWIRLQINGDSTKGEDRCYWDNIILKGIPFTLNPSNVPTNNPSVFPTQNPTQTPSNHPSFTTTQNPTQTPSHTPTNNPSVIPTQTPSNNPSVTPTQTPSIFPTQNPSNNPSDTPTQTPSNNPSKTPSNNPSFVPTQNPIINPSQSPSHNPSNNPTINPSLNPSQTPSNIPSFNPSNNPSNTATLNPSSNNPSISPTQSTFKTNIPPLISTNNPTNVPTYISKSPTLIRNIFTTNNPSFNPSFNPTKYPFKITTFNPTNKPTHNPIQITPNPTDFPSEMPSFSPTPEPTQKPSKMLETTPYDIFNISTNTTLELTVSIINTFNTIDLQSDIKDLYLDNKTGQFDDITLPMVLAVFIGGITLCSVLIVISKRICIKTKNKKPSVTEMNKSTALSNTDGVFINGHNIQNDTCDIISPLQLGDNLNAYHSQIHSKQQCVQQKSTHRVELSNIHSNIPKPSHINMETISDSGIEDTPMEKPHHHIYPTITTSSFGLNSLQHAVENANTSSQFAKLENMLSKLEQKAMEQNIGQNKCHSFDMSSTDTSIYFTTETSVDTTVNKFIPYFNTIHNHNINNKYTETHF